MQERRYSLYEQENPAVRDAFSMLSGNIYMESEHRSIRSIVITSSEPETGKTSIAVSLAATMANWGKKTILIDADMRKRTEMQIPKWGSNQGLSQYLNETAEYEEVLCYTNIDGLMYIPNGSFMPNPMGLICSPRFRQLMERLKEEFEYIIIDSPALDTVSDAVIMSSRADGALLVARMGKSRLEDLNRSKERLEAGEAVLLGVVINKVNKSNYKKYLKAYKYFYTSKREKQKSPKQSKNKNTVVA